MKKTIVILIIFTIVFNTKAIAHPGGTDSDGGHFCWTNCEKWGEIYGEYHYHDDSENQSFLPTVDDASIKEATYQDGYKEAYAYWYARVYSDLKDKINKDGWEATWTDYNENYSKGFKEGFHFAIQDAQSHYKEFEYDRGFEDGKREWDMFQRLSSSELYLRSKEEPDYVRGYEDGGVAEKVKYSNKTSIDIETIEIPQKFQDKQDSFIQGYRKGYFISNGGFNYDDKDYKDFEEEEAQEQYILGYRNGWNDEGSSLSLLMKFNLIFSNLINGNKIVILLPFCLGIGIYLLVRRKFNKS